MATPSEKFQELKKQAVNGTLEIALDQFGSAFSSAGDFFKDLDFDLSKIKILADEANKFKIKAFSKDFLFRKTIFKNESVFIEAEFELINDQLEIFAICKLDKTPNKLSKLPGIIGDVLKPLDFIQINDLVYILTTKATSVIKSVEFPIYNDKQANLKPGINLAGFIDLKNSGKVLSLVTKPLKPVIGEGPYFMSWNLRDKLDIDFSLNLPTDIDIENVFKIKQPKIVLKPIFPVHVSIDGLFDISLPAIPHISVLGGFAFTADGVRGNFSLDKIADKIPVPFGYPGVHISTLTVTAGVSNAIPIVGAEGQFFIGPDRPDTSSKPAVNEFGGVRSNQYKFIYDVIPGKVTPRFAFLFLDKLTMQEYIKALTNKNVSLPSFLDKISMEQIMFHWCETPQGEIKPDGTAALPVFGLSGIINLFGHRTFGELLADATGDSKGKLIAGPINIGNGLLIIGGNGNGTPSKYKGSTKVKPGGMELMFSSDGQPNFFAFSAKVQVLGLSGEAKGTLDDTGITASIQSNLAGIIRDNLEVVFADNHFKADTAIAAKISGLKISLGKLGTVNLNTSLEGTFGATFANDNFSSSMHLKFEFAGIRIDLGVLNVSIKDLKNIVKELEEFIRKEVIEKLTKEVLKWLTAVIGDAIELVGDKLEQVGKALKEVFDESLDNAVKLMKDVGYKAKEVGEALTKGFKAAEQELTNALKKAKYLAEEAGEVLKDVAQIAGEAAAEVLKKAGYTMEEIGRTLKDVYGFGDEKVGQILKSIGGTAEDVARVLRDVFKLGAEQVGNVMKALGYAADAVAGALKIIGEPVESIHKVLVNIFQQPDEAARKVLEAVGFPIKIITDHLPFVKIPLPFVKLPHIKHVKFPHIKF